MLIGECFREGQSCSRNRDTNFGYNNQKECSDSHMKLANKLGNIDIAINTYNTSFKDDLLEWYRDNLVFYNFTDEDYIGFRKVVQRSIQIILDKVNIDNYDYIFITRLDLLLKDELINTFIIPKDTIIYPNIMEHRINNSLKGGFEYMISDVFVIIPKKYFYPFGEWKGLLENAWNMLFHQAVNDLINNGLNFKEHIDFFSNKLYIANTFQSKNPLYKINCRIEPDDIRADMKGLIFDKNKNQIIREN
jgi:hypothetical protein